MISLRPLDKDAFAQAQQLVIEHHYLHRPVDVRTMPEGFSVQLAHVGQIGVLLFGRPEATRCYPWYGSVDDAGTGRAEVTRWQVLNLSRVWLDPKVQPGGAYYSQQWLPGFWDRKGRWHSAVASTVLRLAMKNIAPWYLIRRPPCFVEEPFEIKWLLSYCDRSKHKGTIYAASGFELYRTNDRGIQTWRVRLPELTAEQDEAVRSLAQVHPRSVRFRERRAQLALGV